MQAYIEAVINQGGDVRDGIQVISWSYFFFFFTKAKAKIKEVFEEPKIKKGFGEAKSTTVIEKAKIKTVIEEAWDARDGIGPETGDPCRSAVTAVLEALDSGEMRVASPDGAGGWTVHQWLKKAVLLSFRINDMIHVPGGPGGGGCGTRCRENSSTGTQTASGRPVSARRRARSCAIPLYRPRGGADAKFRQCRSPCRSRHDGRYLGHDRLLRPGRQKLPYLRGGRHRRACSSLCNRTR